MDTTHSNYLLTLLVFCSIGLFCNIAAAADIHVDDSNSGPEDGTIEHPYNTIMKAVNAANHSSAVTIAVAAGTYTENVLIDEHVVVLQGGYSSDFSFRAPSTNITAIQGDGNDAVVTLNTAGASTIDGFTITGGTGNPEYLPDFYAGGGIFVTGGAPVISNNIIENNDTSHSSATSSAERAAGSESDGGGVCSYYANTQIVNNIIRNNTAGYGAGIKVNDGNVVIDGNTISSNVGISDHGGGIHASGPSLEITNNVIENNSIGEALGYGQGGGVIVYGDGTTATLSGNIVRGNTAPSFGAGEFVDDGATATLTNELIYNNTLTADDGLGAGIYVDGWYDDDPDNCTVSHTIIKNVTVADNTCGPYSLACGLAVDICAQATVSNSIFRGHQDLDFHVHSSSILLITYTSSQQIYSGTGNIATDPLFAYAGTGDYHLKSRGGRWDFSSSSWVTDTAHSPAIDSGKPASTYSNEPQPNGGRVNMGAYGNTNRASKSWSDHVSVEFPWPVFLPAIMGRPATE